MIKYQARLAGG